MALTQISTAGVKDDAVTSGKIPANAVGSSELADNAVDTDAIQNGAVTNAKIANASIDAFKLATNAVDADSIQSNAVTNAKIADGNVSTLKIADDAVTVAKIQNFGQNQIAGRVASGTGNLQGLSASDVRTMLNVEDGATASSGTTINNNANNRVITGSGTANTLEGEADLLYDGTSLNFAHGKGARLSYIRPTSQSNTNTGNANQQYWKIGEIGLNGSEGAVITLMGANGYSSGSTSAGETTIVLRGSNGNTLLGFWYSDGAGDSATYSDVRWKHISGVNYELWVSAGPYNNIAPIVKTTGTFDNTNAAGTGSNNAPSGSTALASSHRKKVGSIDTIEYQSTGTIFKRNVVMASGYGIDFSATSDGSGTTSSEVLDDYEEGTFTPILRLQNNTTGQISGTGRYTKVGNVVHCNIDFENADASGIPNGNTTQCTGLPFNVRNSNDNATSTTLMSYGVSVTNRIDRGFYASGNTNSLFSIYAVHNSAWAHWPTDDINQSGIYLNFSITYFTA